MYGACAAWDAALRGLSVAIIEKGDFSSATSANHFKMVHGGIRYLQHADIVRIRESSRERSALLRIAPHMVRPLPVVIPTYGHGLKGKMILAAGMSVFDLLTFDRNQGLHRDRRIPRGRFISREKTEVLFPGIRKEGLTGGALFCDGQMLNPPRLVLCFIRSAAERGAHVANYVEAIELLRKGGSIAGVQARDRLSGRLVNIRGRCVLNAAGPWAHRFLEEYPDLRLTKRPTFSRDLALVLNRRPAHGYALAFSTPTRDSDTIVDRGGRHLFAVPWREYTLVGVWHRFYTDPPDAITVEPWEIQEFVAEINNAYPGFNLHAREINHINTGLTLFGEEGRQGADRMSFGKRSMLIDHAKANGVEGLLTLIGVRATTARGMASKAIDIVSAKLGRKTIHADTEHIPLYGGDIASFEETVSDIRSYYGRAIPLPLANHLAANYGSRWGDLTELMEPNPAEGVMKAEDILRAQIRYAAREEMAVYLSDVLFRRTDLGTGRMPTEPEIFACSQIMADEMGWDEGRRAEEAAAAGEGPFATSLTNKS
jgi:glycerol-3-phosphate dehydrogenase